MKDMENAEERRPGPLGGSAPLTVTLPKEVSLNPAMVRRLKKAAQAIAKSEKAKTKKFR